MNECRTGRIPQASGKVKDDCWLSRPRVKGSSPGVMLTRVMGSDERQRKDGEQEQEQKLGAGAV